MFDNVERFVGDLHGFAKIETLERLSMSVVGLEQDQIDQIATLTNIKRLELQDLRLKEENNETIGTEGQIRLIEAVGKLLANHSSKLEHVVMNSMLSGLMTDEMVEEEEEEQMVEKINEEVKQALVKLQAIITDRQDTRGTSVTVEIDENLLSEIQ